MRIQTWDDLAEQRDRYYKEAKEAKEKMAGLEKQMHHDQLLITELREQILDMIEQRNQAVECVKKILNKKLDKHTNIFIMSISNT